MEKCFSCGAPCEVENDPPYVEKWVDDEGNNRTTTHLGTSTYIFVSTKRKATVDEHITYQELKDHLQELEDECRSIYGSGRSISNSVRERRRKKETVEKTIKLLEEFVDFNR